MKNWLTRNGVLLHYDCFYQTCDYQKRVMVEGKRPDSCVYAPHAFLYRMARMGYDILLCTHAIVYTAYATY